MSIPAAVTLNSGARMPFLAIGTGASSLTAMQQTLLDALELGYTQVDTGEFCKRDWNSPLPSPQPQPEWMKAR